MDKYNWELDYETDEDIMEEVENKLRDYAKKSLELDFEFNGISMAVKNWLDEMNEKIQDVDHEELEEKFEEGVKPWNPETPFQYTNENGVSGYLFGVEAYKLEETENSDGNNIVMDLNFYGDNIRFAPEVIYDIIEGDDSE